VAGAGLVALVGRRTGVRRAAADAGGADVGLGASVPVVAGGAVRLACEAARPVAVAGAGLLARAGRGAGVGGAAAGAGGAHVGLGAGIAVVARRAVGLAGETTSSVAVAGAGLLARTGRR